MFEKVQVSFTLYLDVDKFAREQGVKPQPGESMFRAVKRTIHNDTFHRTEARWGSYVKGD